jgi:hypothetical protein
MLLDDGRQLKQIAHAQARAAGRSQDERVHLCGTGPLRIQAAELARSVVVVDAVLTPGPAPIHQREDLPEQRVEGVCDLEELCRIGQIVRSRRLLPRASSSRA